MARTDDKHAEAEQKFKEAWIVELMRNLESQVDKGTRVDIMESCGRACAKRGAIGLARACNGDVNKMTDQLNSIPDLEIKGTGVNRYQVTYKKCFCELVGKGPQRLPDLYCECSKGWLLEMFGTASGRQVEVHIEQTIKRGGEACIFDVSLG